MENNLASLLRDFAQGASNSAATNLSMPVDVLAWLLRKGGVNVPSNPVGGSDWMAEKGFTREPKNKLAGILGDAAGFAAPLAAVTKAPQIARGLLGMGEAMPTMSASKAYPTPLKDQRGAITWHGSPHKFDAFDASKIGTGEGAQAYGHGLYLAESPDVAKGYKNTLSEKAKFNTSGESLNKNRFLDENGVFYEKQGKKYVTWDGTELSKKDFDAKYKSANNAYLNADVGSLYKVDLPDEHIAKMLDWDKPLSQQAPDVQSAVNNYFALSGKEHYIPKGQTTPVVVGEGISGDTTGKQFYEYLRGNKGAGGAAEALRWGDIPGIKYLDGGSRGAGQGSSNYVVFPGNERLLKILERNGQTP